jgi:hypothetical protein
VLTGPSLAQRYREVDSELAASTLDRRLHRERPGAKPSSSVIACNAAQDLRDEAWMCAE